ncbi:hypothetical protein EV426DRAFT_616787 [Tirmania nivea]|nr:hypothetical protein EV426DRAFT_616787 [Tirmania nivea]
MPTMSVQKYGSPPLCYFHNAFLNLLAPTLHVSSVLTENTKRSDSNIDPSLQDAQHSLPQQPQITPPHTQEPTSPAHASPQKRRRSRKSVDISNSEGRDVADGGVTSPKAKRARPSPRVKNPAPGGVPQNDQPHLMSVAQFAHQTNSPGVTHMVPQAYATHIQQPPTAPMNYAPPVPLPPMPRKLLPPKHDTASSLTGYLSYITAKSAALFIPPVINTSFTLPWSFRIPRESITVPTTPGGKSIPIHDLLFRLTLRNDVSNGQDGDDKQGNKEMEALVSMARKSMDVQNCLTEVAMSLVKVVQGVDGFVYVMSAASRVPVQPGDHVDGASQGLLGGNWDITFLCTCSEEAKTLPEQAKVASSEESAEAQATKHVACQGRIVIGFLEQEETVILKYRHCPLHRPSGDIVHHTPAERTIVGGVVSRKAPNPPIQPQQHPNGTAAYSSSNFYPQQQSHGYVLVNGQWYYPQHTPGTPGHYSQPQQTSPPRVAHQQYQGITHPDPLPGDSMAQIYSAAMAQYSAPSRRKVRSDSISDASAHAHSHGDASTEQRLLEQLSRELAGHPQQHAQQGGNVKTGPEQVHHEGQGQEQQQGYDYPAGYTYPGSTAYAHSAVTPLTGGAELGNGNGEVGEGGADGERNTNMGGQEEQGHGGHEQAPVSSVDPTAGVKELVQQLVQQAQAGAGANGVAAVTATATDVPPPPPTGSESPETRRRRGRASKS